MRYPLIYCWNLAFCYGILYRTWKLITHWTWELLLIYWLLIALLSDFPKTALDGCLNASLFSFQTPQKTDIVRNNNKQLLLGMRSYRRIQIVKQSLIFDKIIWYKNKKSCWKRLLVKRIKGNYGKEKIMFRKKVTESYNGNNAAVS